jgi:multiple sugar transport system permease protein
MPLTIWVLTSFFRELPFELEEAAKVDGATPLQAFTRIIIPLAAPGVFTCAILVFIAAWNEFLFALTFMTNDMMRTVPVAITMYPGEHEIPWGTIFAAASIVTLPLIMAVLLLQRRIVAGLTAGAVKG